MIKTNAFRQDLYYRINVLPIHVPPLKERKEDIPLLTRHFLSRIAKQVGSVPKSLSQAASEKLHLHAWPGNVRELKNVIERGAIISDTDIIGPKAILFGHEIEKTIQELKSGPAHLNAPVPGSLKAIVGRYEKEVIESVLLKHASIRKAARALDISHTAMLNKMKKYQISKKILGN